ncbi:MAG TPA: hypothetical protein VMT38_13890 [Terracidiphilus sp.]|nr:hypothetical protein [Terracidiphilus sp.]
MPYSQRNILAAVTLFVVAPLVAEYLLGDFSITFLWPLLVMMPMYGGGALLIRELTRRTGRGWPSILLLGCAYAIIEEAFTTQSLFNPHYLGMTLLSHAWIPSLGISAWWTLFMLNVHPFWSIGVSIALVEGLFPSAAGVSSSVRVASPAAGLSPSRVPAPWLGKVGLTVAAVFFSIGAFFSTTYQLHHDPFRASRAQLLVSALFVVLFAAAAFLIPPASRSQSTGRRNPGPVPPPWVMGAIAFILGAAVFFAPAFWDWPAVFLMFGVDLVFLVALGLFSRCEGWTPLHTLSAGAGGALFYGVHAFMQPPVTPTPKPLVLMSHTTLLVLAAAVIAAGALRTRAARRAALTSAPAEVPS